MDTCDVLIVGGGPAGSTCARRLRQAGLDVILMDKHTFPRDKPCAGWITPAVLTTLGIDRDEYRRGRVLQEINSFRTGLMDGPEVVTSYGETVSFGIRRCEFDHYLLQRSAVRLALGEPAFDLAWNDGWWLVNGRIKARFLVGAGGHFCPVARHMGARIGREEVIAAQVAEFAMSPGQERLCGIPPDTPALFFCSDLKGYGWVFRKGHFLNVGLGRMDRGHIGRHVRDFCGFLEKRGDLPTGTAGTFRGHTYLLFGRHGGRLRVADGALLIGDAAGIAYPCSGEGILPAIESALLAADSIIASGGDYRRDNLGPYESRLSALFGSGGELPSAPLAATLFRVIGAKLLTSRWFTRHIVLNRWFLHSPAEPIYFH